jgi:hypothetical protein
MARTGVRERMVRVVDRWRRSGQSAAVFCRRHRMKPQQLSYWKRALGEAGPARTTGGPRSRRSRLVPVRLVDGMKAGVVLEVQLASGDRLVLHEGSPREVVQEVLGLLRSRC